MPHSTSLGAQFANASVEEQDDGHNDSDDRYADGYSHGYDNGAQDAGYDAGYDAGCADYDDGYANGYELHDGCDYAPDPDDQDDYQPIFNND